MTLIDLTERSDEPSDPPVVEYVFDPGKNSYLRAGTDLISIITVHGLFEGALQTWTEPKSRILWLRDLFPHRKCRARVLAYSYKANALASAEQGSADRILPIASSLVAELSADRQLSDALYRPIIFVCHGVGGLLVKRSLAFSSTRRSKSVEHLRAVYISTYAVLFMGTPHLGITKEAVLCGWTEPSQFLISLLKGSDMIQEITDQFAPLMKRFAIFNFWEELETVTGKVKRYLVDEHSAAPIWDSVERCAISATHSGMVKFKSAQDQGYRVVLEALIRYIKMAPDFIQVRSREDKRRSEADHRLEAEMLLGNQLDTVVSENRSPTDINEWFIVPRCSSNHFTGRQMHANLVKQQLGTVGVKLAKQKYHRIFVICGLGGSGKTQFCLRYVEENRSRYTPYYLFKVC